MHVIFKLLIIYVSENYVFRTKFKRQNWRFVYLQYFFHKSCIFLDKRKRYRLLFNYFIFFWAVDMICWPYLTYAWKKNVSTTIFVYISLRLSCLEVRLVLLLLCTALLQYDNINNQLVATIIILLIISISSACFGPLFRPSSWALDCVYSLWYKAGSIVGALYHKL